MMSKFIAFIIILSVGVLANANTLPQNSTVLDTPKTISSDFYLQSDLLHKHYRQKNVKKFTDIETLSELIKQQSTLPNRFSNIQLIIGNSDLIRRNIEHSHVMTIFDFLLKMEALEQAKEMLLIATQTASDNVISKMHYRLAVFYSAHEQWKNTLTEIDSITARNALTQDESDYAHILYGLALQQIKDHRQAISYYDQVSSESQYYGYAQLNKAIAFLRQGWWTDAKIAIEAATKADNINREPELLNRLFLFIGYAQIHHEFYRNARNSFRKVTVSSQYANKALLGIGLCAMHQDDLMGGLNAFNLLQKKDSDDLAVIESRLLSAYTYALLGKQKIAAEQYEKAIIYYQQKLNTLISEKEMSLQSIPLDSDYLPLWLKIQTESLQEFKQLPLSDNDRKALSSLQYRFTLVSKNLLEKAYHEKIDIISSYLAQSQLGQAQLYDKDK